jgi:hypothetical protein
VILLNFSKGWQVGGDAYTAVAVAKKIGTGGWVVYNIFRDHLGTITHLKNGSTIDEYSFDAWGRRRDKDDWKYTLSGEPALFADCGLYCVPDFLIIIANLRSLAVHQVLYLRCFHFQTYRKW